jgi:hypothetical protein
MAVGPAKQRGMNIDWRRVGAAGSVIGGIAIMHGLKSRRWRYLHTFGVVLGIVSTVAPILKRVKAIRATQV